MSYAYLGLIWEIPGAGLPAITGTAAWVEAKDGFAASGAVFSSVTASAAWIERRDIFSALATNGNTDTHDPGLRKLLKREEERRQRRFEEERAERERRRAQVIDAFERHLEGAPEIPIVLADEIVDRADAEREEYEEAAYAFEAMLSSAEKMQALWNGYLERDDEEVLALL